MSNTELPFRRKVRCLLIMVLLLAGLFVNYGHHERWDSPLGHGDEPAYIENASKFWHSGTFPGLITWSPGYVVLMSPFVGTLGQESGYKLWRLTLLGSISLMVFVIFSQIFQSRWIGIVTALYSQMFLMPYSSPSLQSLLALIYLFCLWLLMGRGKWLGAVFGVLLNGIFVSGTVGFVFSAFGFLCLLYCPRWIFNKRFFIQFLIGGVLFAGVVYHFSFDLKRYSEEASQRGRAGLYHQLSLFIWKSGRLSSYDQTGILKEHQKGMDEELWPSGLLDRYYLEKFGGTENDLRARRNDPRWPLFLLDWPWMLEKDPELMMEYQGEVLRTLRDSVLGAFEVQFPLGGFDIRTSSMMTRAIYNIVAFLTLIALLLLPSFVKVAKKEPLSQLALAKPSHLQLLFLLACLSTMIPLMLVKPLAIYFPPFIPVYLMGVVLLARGIVRWMK